MFSNNILAFLIVFYTLMLSNGQKDKKFFRSDYQYLEATQSFYKISSFPRTFAEAKEACAMEGASLFYAEDQAEADAVISVWNSTQPTWWTIHIGISALLVKGVYETIDGKRVSEVYHDWISGEPNDSFGTEDCVLMGSNGKFNDVACDRKNPYICKKTLQSVEWDFACNMNDLGYTYIAKTDNCYKFHSTPRNWTDAYNICSAEQSYLAVINDRVEVEYLVRLVVPAPKDWVAGSYFRGMYHIGFHNRFNQGWQTVKGSSINESLIWWSNQPNEGSYDQCGSMFYTGSLNQINCTAKCFFICEHDVNQFSRTQSNEETTKVL